MTVLERAVVYHEQTGPQSYEDTWQTVNKDTPISKIELQSPYSGSTPCLRKAKFVKFATLDGTEKRMPKVYTQSRPITIAAEKSVKLWR